MKIIVFEGVDGSGKTYIISKVRKQLVESNYKVLVYEDAGFSDLGVTLRPLLLENKLDEKTKFDLFCAIRRENLYILNRIKDNYDYVLIDRYLHSTLVYNNVFNDIGKTYYEMSRRIELIKPDHSFVIEPSNIEDVKERLLARGEEFDYIAIMNIIADYRKVTAFVKSLGYSCDILKNSNDDTITQQILKSI